MHRKRTALITVTASLLAAAAPASASHRDWFEDGKVTKREARHQIREFSNTHRERLGNFLVHLPSNAYADDPRVARTTVRLAKPQRISRGAVEIATTYTGFDRNGTTVRQVTYRYRVVAKPGRDGGRVENRSVIDGDPLPQIPAF